MAGERISSARLRAILGGSAGNLVEWYDFYAYSALTIYFAPSFFPKGDPTAQLLSAAAIFAVGFLMRPLGAWLMGIYGDRHGRKSGLALSVGLMFAGSLLIAIAPTYASVGAWAPTTLVFARMLQGVSVGGEYGASATYLSEMAPRRRRGFWSSFQYVTLIAGQLAALSVVLILQSTLSDEQIQSWGWRIPFFLGAILALAVYLLRSRLDETSSFKAMPADRPRSSLVALWQSHPKEFIVVAAITAGGSLCFYAYTTYMQKFLVNTSGFSRQTATQIMTAALFAYMCAQPVFGHLADRFGRRPMLLGFGITGTLATVPVYHVIAGTDDALVAFLLITAMLLVLSSYTSISALVKAELFPAHIRTLGVALPYAIANAVFGGTAEYVALGVKQAGVESAFYWYVSVMIAIALVAFYHLPETRDESLIKE